MSIVGGFARGYMAAELSRELGGGFWKAMEILFADDWSRFFAQHEAIFMARQAHARAEKG